MNSEPYDAIVVGGGLAGLSAAIRIAEQGGKVAVLEQGETADYLCNSRVAMGFFAISGVDMRSDPELLLATIRRLTEGEADDRLAIRFSNDCRQSFAWILRQGVKFIQFGSGPGRRPVLVPLVQLRPGLNWRGRGADMMLRKLTAALDAAGGQLLLGHRVEELLVEGDRCTGVVARTAAGGVRLTAKGVILADGGFQADPDLMRKYVSGRPDRLLQRNMGTGRGDGLRMAEAIGAALTPMNSFYGHVQSRNALVDSSFWPYPTADFLVSAGIAVDEHGNRFTDEGWGGISIANAIARLDDPGGAFAIFDRAVWEGPGRSFLIAANPNLTRQGATIHQGGDIREVAEKAGLPAATLAATVEEYNRSVDAGALDTLSPSRTGSMYRPFPIRVPPIYAMPICAGVTYTMGGIAIDENARVRRRDGGTFRGLYAAGSTTGGHEGGPHAGYTGGLAKALVFGLTAANDLVATLK